MDAFICSLLAFLAAFVLTLILLAYPRHKMDAPAKLLAVWDFELTEEQWENAKIKIFTQIRQVIANSGYATQKRMGQGVSFWFDYYNGLLTIKVDKKHGFVTLGKIKSEFEKAIDSVGEKNEQT